MKLINPTDDQLNAAFAEKVAGWHFEDECGWTQKKCGPYSLGDFPGFPDFTGSADAVLPWLEAEKYWGCDRNNISTRIWVRTEDGFFADDKSFPRAAVIALLRAHGVEVEFTK